jgi:hypothetical protein
MDRRVAEVVRIIIMDHCKILIGMVQNGTVTLEVYQLLGF